MDTRAMKWGLVSLAMMAASAGLGQDINQRVENQQDRINQGVQSGALTPAEARNVQAQHNRILASEERDRAANGGRLTSAERRRLNHRLNRASGNIYGKKHNGRRR